MQADKVTPVLTKSYTNAKAACIAGGGVLARYPEDWSYDCLKRIVAVQKEFGADAQIASHFATGHNSEVPSAVLCQSKS